MLGAESPADVQFAGFAITGDAAGSNASVQGLALLIQGEAAVARNQRLLVAAQGAAPQWFQLQIEGLAALDGTRRGRGTALIVACRQSKNFS